MKMIMVAMVGTLLLALLSDCGYSSMQGNEEAAPEGKF